MPALVTKPAMPMEDDDLYINTTVRDLAEVWRGDVPMAVVQ